MGFPKTLRVASGFNPELFDAKENEDGTIKLSGYDAKLLEILSEFLKFKYQLISYKEHYGRKLPDGNWSGLTGMLMRGEVDLGFGEMAITNERLKVIDFSIPYVLDDTVFVIKHMSPKQSISSILLPFDVNVWIWLLVSTLIVPAIYIFLLKSKHSYTQLLLDTIGNLLNHGSTVRYNSGPAKVLHGTWSLTSTILSFAYCAVLLSFITVPPHERGIRNLQELSAAVAAGTHRCFTHKGSLALDNLVKSDKQHLRILGKAIVKNKWYINESFNKEHKLGKKSDAVIMIRSLASLQFGAPNKEKFKYLGPDSYVLVMSEDSLVHFELAIGLRKGFCCKKKLDSLLQRILRTGIFQRHVALQNYKAQVKFSWKSDPWRYGVAKVNLVHSTGAFKILFFGILIAFVVLVFENSTFYFAQACLNERRKRIIVLNV